MKYRDMTADELQRIIADSVAALLANHVEPEERRKQKQAREQLADNRAISRALRRHTRRKIIAGGAVLDEADVNPEFGAQLRDIIARRVINPRDRDFMAASGHNKAGTAGAAAPVDITPPTATEFDAMAEQLLANANMPDT